MPGMVSPAYRINAPTASSAARKPASPPWLVMTKSAMFRTGMTQATEYQFRLLPAWVSARPPASGLATTTAEGVIFSAQRPVQPEIGFRLEQPTASARAEQMGREIASHIVKRRMDRARRAKRRWTVANQSGLDRDNPRAALIMAPGLIELGG